MDVELLFQDLKRVRERGIPKTSLDEVPALKEALAGRWPDLDDAGRTHRLEDFLAEAADQLEAPHAMGMRLALDIGGLVGGNSADRRAAFAQHHGWTGDTVRNKKHGRSFEEHELARLAKEILSLAGDAPRPATSNQAPTSTAPETMEYGRAIDSRMSRDESPRIILGMPSEPGLTYQRRELDAGKRGAPEHRSVVEYGSARISTSTITSRARAHLAIDSFEQDLRQSIERFLLDHLPPEEVFSAEYDQLCAQRAQDDVSETRALTQYLDPEQAYDVLRRHTDALPAELADVLRLNRSALDGFVSVRNRVMRGRPLQPDDLDKTEWFIGRFRSQYFPQTDDALNQLASDSGWQPRPRIGSSPTDRIQHNLPPADFEETGLLGREGQIHDLVSKVKRRHDRMVALIGEGGIGKTALALAVCYRLADDPESPFEAILWTSLKSERLEPAGIRELSDAIRDIAGATSALGQAIDQTFQGSARELAEALREKTTLIVIDNLETVQGSEVARLYDALPETVTFLFTSRDNVGEIERHVPVAQLDEESAERLFRKFAGSRGQSELAEWPPTKVGNVLGRLRYSPLAIRWYILSVAAGKTPTDTLRNQDELVRFCVENVVTSLSSDERLLLDVLRVLDHPVSFDELAVFSEMEIDTLRRGAQRLKQGSLIVWSYLAGADESELLALSLTARAFLRTLPEPEVAEDVIRKETAYNQERERERERIADHGRYLDPNVIFERSFSDSPIAHLLQQALRESKSGHPEAASAAMVRARALNPGYFEVDRVDALLASFRKETARATTLYRSAQSNCSTDEERSWVGYFFASHLARQASDLPAAIRLTEKAHALFSGYDTALQLGNFYVWDRRFEEGKQLIESALEQAPHKPRFERIATSWLVECFRRWSEADLASSLPPASLHHALRGMHLGIELHDSGTTDEQLMRSIIEVAVAALKAVPQIAELGPEEERRLASALEHLVGDARFSLLSPWRHLVYAVSSLTVEMRSRLAPGFAEPGERILGSVVQLRAKYGFIEHPDFPNNVFFHAGSLLPPTRFEDIGVGSQVEFTPFRNDEGQDRALDVLLARDANRASAVDK